MEKTEQTITLSDGRKLGFAEYGFDRGSPVFYFHGAATSRYEQLFDERELVDKKVRLICIDRPGHGLSDFQPDRTLLDWPDDIEQLVKHLSLSKLNVIGYSHGGPYALACCYQLPERIISGTIVSSWAPPNRPGAYQGMPIGNRILNGSARWFPWLTRNLRRMMRVMMAGDVQKVAKMLMSSVPESDKDILSSGKAKDNLTLSVREGFRTGWEGVAYDDIVVNQNWEFEISEIDVPITIWHGELDVNIPYHAAIYLHARLANSNLISMPDEGHFVMVKHASKILSSVVSSNVIK
jgi:pimeloyl-ACP methyl ester carboxylesterase